WPTAPGRSVCECPEVNNDSCLDQGVRVGSHLVFRGQERAVDREGGPDPVRRGEDGEARAAGDVAGGVDSGDGGLLAMVDVEVAGLAFPAAETVTEVGGGA